MAQSLRVVDILVTSQAAADRLPQQVGEGKLGVLTAARIRQALSDQMAEGQTRVQLANQNQAAVGGDSGSLEIDLQRSVERELKGLVLFVTPWGWASGVSSSPSNPYG